MTKLVRNNDILHSKPKKTNIQFCIENWANWKMFFFSKCEGKKVLRLTIEMMNRTLNWI